MSAYDPKRTWAASVPHFEPLAHQGYTRVRLATRGTARSAVDIAAWLKSLGLEQYEPAFRANAIDADVLPKLTAEERGYMNEVNHIDP